MPLDLDIDRLAVPGINPLTRYRLTAALEAEFDRLVDRHGLPAGWQAGRVDVGQATFEVAQESSPAEIGVQVARQLFAGLHRQATGEAPAELRDPTVDGRRV